jgi:hypothetical protein
MVLHITYTPLKACHPSPHHTQALHLLSCPWPPQAAVYDSVARDFAGSPEAWDLRARRHTLALSAAALPAERLAGVQAAVGVYEEGLRAAPSSELVAALLAFLQQQLRELDECSASGGSSPAAGSHEEQQQRAAEVAAAAEWLRLRSQRAYEEAWADGLLTEALRLDNISFLLHQGEVEPALAAARQAVKALPQSAALWQQLIVLQAQISAEQLAQGAGQQAQQEGAQSSDEEEDAVMVQPAGAAAAAHRSRSTPSQQRLEGLVVQALQAVPAADAVPVWLTAITVLCGNGCSLEGLCRQMVQAALRQARGPVEVRHLACAALGVEDQQLPVCVLLHSACLGSTHAAALQSQNESLLIEWSLVITLLLLPAGWSGSRSCCAAHRAAPGGGHRGSARPVHGPAAAAASWWRLFPLPAAAGDGAGVSGGASCPSATEAARLV